MKTNYEITMSDAINHAYPGARIGILALELLSLKETSQAMDRMTEEVILDLKEKYPEPAELKKNELIEAYALYYKKYKKTYHLIPQLESVIFNNKKIQIGIPLLQAVFTAELKNMLLTAVHDLNTIQFPISMNLASGKERYLSLNGSEVQTKNGDMFMSDLSGVISSIIYGPDQRTKISPLTSNVMIVVYAPDGIGRNKVENHLEDLLAMMGLISVIPKVLFRKILPENTPC